MIARFAIPFFFMMSLVVAPLVLWWIIGRFTSGLKRILIPFACTLLIWGVIVYGYLVGFRQFEVHRVEYVSPDIPDAFDGYRIVHFSDAHIGTLSGSRWWMIYRAVDSINAQHPDAIVFTGDLVNISADELTPASSTVLRTLYARDGVFSVLGNHDYPIYMTGSEQEKTASLARIIEGQRRMEWTLLMNEHRVIRRGSDSIVIAGMQNWGRVKRMPRKGDVRQTLSGLGNAKPFTVMLQHDPSCWREKILPECGAQLTLSGHTHGGQFSLFGWSPVSLKYDEWGGWTYEGNRAIHVSTGMGALVPFRFGLPGEITVITLRKTPSSTKN